MADVLLFHHAQGVTPGIRAFADHLGEAGHTVHVPDLFDGHTFDSIEDGLAHVAHIGGFGEVLNRAGVVADGLPENLVYIGFSLGVVPAQMLTQTRPGAAGGVFCYSCLPAAEFGSWPDGVPAQVHGMDADPFFADEGDLDAARELVASGAPVELFVYLGDQHYFADSSLPSYRPEAAELLTRRVLEFLATR
jgi:dienelactone hydrolase